MIASDSHSIGRETGVNSSKGRRRRAAQSVCAQVRRARQAGHFLIAEYRAVQNRDPTRIKFDEKVKLRRAPPQPRNAF